MYSEFDECVAMFDRFAPVESCAVVAVVELTDDVEVDDDVELVVAVAVVGGSELVVDYIDIAALNIRDTVEAQEILEKAKEEGHTRFCLQNKYLMKSNQ